MPNPNYHGPDSFTFSINDGQYSDEATVSITVGPINDAPVAGGDSYTTDEDTTLTIAADPKHLGARIGLTAVLLVMATLTNFTVFQRIVWVYRHTRDGLPAGSASTPAPTARSPKSKLKS